MVKHHFAIALLTLGSIFIFCKNSTFFQEKYNYKTLKIVVFCKIYKFLFRHSDKKAGRKFSPPLAVRPALNFGFIAFFFVTALLVFSTTTVLHTVFHFILTFLKRAKLIR